MRADRSSVPQQDDLRRFEEDLRHRLQHGSIRFLNELLTAFAGL